MKTRYSFALAALAMTFAFAAPALAQDVAKEGEAAATETMKDHDHMMGEGCQCTCMKEMHEKMMEMHGDAEGHAEGMAHAEGMDAEGMDSEAHAEMMAAHKEMMEGCKCMSGAEGEGAMSCKMHGGNGMGAAGEGMQHQHGMEPAKADASEGDSRD